MGIKMGLIKQAFKFIFSPITTKGVFDSEEVVSLVDKGMSMADDAIYTKQEKARNHTKFLDWWLKYLDTTKGQNIARRELAVYSVRTYLFLVIFSCLIFKFYPEWSNQIFLITKEALLWLVAAIVTFYFGVGAFKNYTNGKNGK